MMAYRPTRAASARKALREAVAFHHDGGENAMGDRVDRIAPLVLRRRCIAGAPTSVAMMWQLWLDVLGIPVLGGAIIGTIGDAAGSW